MTFFRRSFLAPNRQNSSWANLSVFQNYSGFKIFWIIGSSQFCRFYCLTSPKIIVSEPVCVSEFFWYQKVWIIGVSRFCRSFLSHSTEKFRRGILVFLKSYGIEKLLDNKVSRFCRLFFSHSAEKFAENPPMIQKN